MSTPETDHFGFTRVGEGETISKNSFAALDTDRVTLDLLLNAIVNHDHGAEPALTGPDDPPDLTPSDTGGSLNANTTYYYKVSYIDRHGLETRASPEQSIATAAGAGLPDPPSLTHESTGGVLNVGTYQYMITFADLQGGESTPSEVATIQLTSDICFGTSRILLDFPSPPLEAPCINVYRKKPGQTRYYFLLKTTNSSEYDDGSITEDITIGPPTVNTTSSSNSVTITVPGGVIPEGVEAWNIYRSRTAGVYSSSSLVKTVSETEFQTGGDLVTSWVDIGGNLLQGGPKQMSSTISGGRIIQLNQFQGTFPLSATPRGASSLEFFFAGQVEHMKVYAKTQLQRPMRPVALSAFFQDEPAALGGATPAYVRIVASDGSNEVDLICDDNSGYYTRQFPLVLSGEIEAETSEDRDAFSPVVNDTSASNGQAVELDSVNEYVTVSLGQLEAGQWFVTVRARTHPAITADDMRIQVIEDVTTILDQTFTLGLSYADNTTDPFTANGVDEMFVRVSKDTSSTNIIYVDKVAFETNDVPQLEGELTVTAHLENQPATPVPGGDVQFVLFY